VIGGGIASAGFRADDAGLRRWILTKINQRLQPLDRGGHAAIYAPSFRRIRRILGFRGLSMTRAFIFPGQGSQAVGMGLALSQGFAAARLVFEEVDEALKQKLSKLMFEGPESDLVLTENAQPALMAVSIAALRVLEAEGGWRLADKASYVAGHSLGEYSALAAAGALGLSEAARLLKLRGQAMQKAVPVGVGAMAALLGPELEQVQKIA
jgi:[acyl-carrier-protein] S-malonyltransferase